MLTSSDHSDDPHKPRFIETVVGKGYRFAALVAVELRGSGLLEVLAGAARGFYLLAELLVTTTIPVSVT